MTHFLCLKRHTAIIIQIIANKNSEPGITAVGVGETAGDGVGDGIGVRIGVTVGVTVGMGVAVGVKCGIATSFSFLGDGAGVGEGS